MGVAQTKCRQNFHQLKKIQAGGRFRPKNHLVRASERESHTDYAQHDFTGRVLPVACVFFTGDRALMMGVALIKRHLHHYHSYCTPFLKVLKSAL